MLEKSQPRVFGRGIEVEATTADMVAAGHYHVMLLSEGTLEMHVFSVWHRPEVRTVVQCYRLDYSKAAHICAWGFETLWPREIPHTSLHSCVLEQESLRSAKDAVESYKPTQSRSRFWFLVPFTC